MCMHVRLFASGYDKVECLVVNKRSRLHEGSYAVLVCTTKQMQLAGSESSRCQHLNMH